MTTLQAGDIAFIGFNFDNPDEFAFVALTDFAVGTQINFTDNGWLSSGGFRGSEGTFTWTAPAAITAGTIVNPALSGVAFSVNGDQILAYQGTTASPTFLAAINSDGTPGIWQPEAISTNTSAEPTGLGTGQSLALDEIDNAVYDGPISGTKAALIAALNDPDNWTGSNATRQSMPTAEFTVTDAGTGGGSPVLVGFEDFDGGEINRAATVNVFDYDLGGGSGPDVFGRVTPTSGMPFDVADDTVADVSGGGTGSAFPSDGAGLAGQNTSAFFALNDADAVGVNNALWRFDLGGESTLDRIEIDLAALGDFEAGSSDGFRIEARLDTGTFQTIFLARSDDNASKIYRALDNGTVITSDDPLALFIDGSDTSIGFLDKSDPVTGDFDTYTSTLFDGQTAETFEVRLNWEGTPSGAEPMGIDNIAIFGSVPTTPPPSLSIADVVQAEGNAGSTSFVFTISLSEAVEGDVTFTASTADGTATAGADYTAKTQTLTIEAGETEAEFTVSVSSDSVPEADEMFTVILSDVSGAVVSDGSGEGTIENDDGPVITLISAIQGSGSESPLDDAVVTIRAVVTGDYRSGYDGFFVQEEDVDADSDASTSEGLFVSTFGESILDDVALAEGDLVELTGTVNERFGMTRLEDVTAFAPLLSTASGVPTASQIALPIAGDPDAFFEAYEGMLVQFPQELTITQLFNYERFGELQLSSQGRVYQYTQLNAPDVDGNAAYQALDAATRIILDDGKDEQNPDNLPFQDVPTFSAGDTVRDLTGVLSFNRGNWEVEPTERAPIVFTDSNPAEPTPEDVGGSLKVAAFNVLNYFTTLDVPGNDVNGLDPRGANSAAELQRQTDKIVAALKEMDADVIGLIEIENDSDDASAKALVSALNAELTSEGSSSVYGVVETGKIGNDAIKVAFIYDTTTIRIAEDTTFAVLDTDAFVAPVSTILDPNDLLTTEAKNRPALAVTFEELASGEQFTAVNNHFKSKGSDVDGEDMNVFGPANTILSGSDLGTIDGVQPTIGVTDGQGNGSATRESAADQLVDWLATNPTGGADPDILILGDLNAYAKDTAIGEILEGADDTGGTEDDYTDLANEFIGDSAYSFRFSGQWGTLDYALANNALLSQVTGVTEWHVNSDMPAYLDYNDNIEDPNESFFNAVPDALEADFDADTPFRSSDHDPIIIGLELGVEPTPFRGTRLSDTFVADNRDDKFLLRWGQDTATGEGGADRFIIDSRYVEDGDAHRITDLNFGEGDLVNFRFFDVKRIISSQEDLAFYTDNGFATINSTASDGSLDITFQNFDENFGSPNQRFIGTRENDIFDGQDGQDTFVIRFGSDDVTGGSDADTFIFDARSIGTGSNHLVNDLDFDQGDVIKLRFFDGPGTRRIDSQADLEALDAQSFASVSDTIDGLRLTLENGDGETMNVTFLDVGIDVA